MLFKTDHDHDDGRSQQLSAWLDRELDAESARELEAELCRDTELRDEVEELRELDKALAKWPAPSVTPDLRPAVLARIRKDLAASIWQRMRLVWSDLATTAGWAVAGVMVGFILMTRMDPGTHAGVQARSNETEIMITMTMPQEVATPADYSPEEN